MTQLEHLKQQIKTLLAAIETLERQNIAIDSEATRYEIGCGVLFFMMICTNAAWLTVFLGG